MAIEIKNTIYKFPGEFEYKSISIGINNNFVNMYYVVEAIISS